MWPKKKLFEAHKPETAKSFAIHLDSSLTIQSKRRYLSKMPSSTEEMRTKYLIISNMWLLNKLMTTKFPASAVVMELAAYMKARSLKAAVQWAPRSVNQEADSLANGDTSAFSPELREVIERKWVVLPDALKMGRSSKEEFIAFKRSGFDPKRCERRLKRKKPTERLRLTDPW